MIMLSKINIALSLNISVALKWNMKSLSSWKQEWEGGLQLSEGMVLQGKQTSEGTENTVETGPGLTHHTQGAHHTESFRPLGNRSEVTLSMKHSGF